MQLRNLQYFEKLVELENYSNVADYFHVGQPAVSMGIKRLEKEVGHRLVVHNSKHNIVNLTPAGVKLHKHTKKFMQQVKIFEIKVRQEL
ncbi:helix-turn-helix domain-containing protein [Fructilactobacillus frigidiflavus]|uniref:helix-turn-helix domain-containing protein n=1 Tax=Fructilactobacillus frigidiflavus TaxID=3242688 RepID=UPI003758047A